MTGTETRMVRVSIRARIATLEGVGLAPFAVRVPEGMTPDAARRWAVTEAFPTARIGGRFRAQHQRYGVARPAEVFALEFAAVTA